MTGRKRKSFAIEDLIDVEEFSIHPALRRVTTDLEGQCLWRKFHESGTEMIVTKAGRRMFPNLQIRLKGLEPETNYSVSVDFRPVDTRRFRYSFRESAWIPAGPGDPELPPRVHLHPESPASGAHWSRQAISFEKLKLTNNQLDTNAYIILNSMHKYCPRITVSVDGTSTGSTDCSRFFEFPETTFMAVTAYQNHRITRLKIASNPFAKGFREGEGDDWPSSPFLGIHPAMRSWDLLGTGALFGRIPGQGPIKEGPNPTESPTAPHFP